jgi:hypothetical protein
MNYTELTTAIQDYTENTFSADQLATFVSQAEERVFNTVQFPSLRKNVTGQTTASNKYLSAPSDFLSVFSLAVIDSTGSYEFLLNKDVNFIRQAYPNPNSLGIPKYYALFGPTTIAATPDPLITNELSFILGPTPNTQYNMELHYFFYPQSISESPTGTSWLGDNYSPVLLYGSLVEANTFMKGEPDMTAMYEAKYKEALAQAKRLGDGLERGDAYRNGQYRQAVT